MKISELYKIFNEGDIVRDCRFSFFDKIDNISEEGNVVFLTGKKYIEQLDNPLISGVITTRELEKEVRDNFKIGIWVHPNPKDLFYRIHEYLIDQQFYFKPWENKIHPTAKIADKAIIPRHSVTIGPGSIIDDHVIIKPFSIIGENSIIRSNSDIGSDGFEVTTVNGKLKVIKHAGLIILGNGVEIQSLNTVSRGLFPSRNTILGDDVKTADLVHIAHGVHIGDRTMITAGVTVSGNSTIGCDVIIGPGAVISNRLTIGDNANISIGAIVVRNVPAGQKVSGDFAIEHEKRLKYIIKNKLI